MTTMKMTFKQRLINNLITKWKSYLYALIVLFSIVGFLYTLGYSTSWATTEVLGKNFKVMQPLFDQANATNNTILVLGAGFLLSAVLGLGFGTHNRKKYYLSNYITVGTTIGFGLLFSLFVIFGSLALKGAFEESFATYNNNWNYVVQLVFQSRDPRPDIIASFDSIYAIGLMGLVSVGLVTWLLVDNLLNRKAVLTREAYVKDILTKVETGEIKVSEKVMNQIPSVDDEIIDFSDKEILEYEHFEKGKFYQNHKLPILISYFVTLIFTLMISLLLVGNYVFGILYQMELIDFSYSSLTGIQSSVIDFGMILVLIVIFFNLSALKQIKSIKHDMASRSVLMGQGWYLLFTTIIAGVFILPVAYKLKPSKYYREKMRYQKNSFGYSYTFGAMLFFIWSLFTSITYSTFTFLPGEVRVIPDANVALDISISIILILVMFLAAEKVKVYSVKWSIGLLVISAINIARIFYVPLISLNTNQIPIDIFIQIAVSHTISALLTGIAGVVSYKKSKQLQLLMKEKGV